MLGILVALLVLGGLAAIAIVAVRGDGNGARAGADRASAGAPTTLAEDLGVSPSVAGQQANQATCLAMAATIETASQAYSSASATGAPAAGLDQLREYLHDLPTITKHPDGTSSVTVGGGTITYRPSDGSVTNTCA
jgi:hypothetical protein